MQAEVTALTIRIGALESEMRQEKALSVERHQQNRQDVHNLRDTFQAGFERISERFSVAIDKMSDRLSENIEKAIKPIAEKQAVHEAEIVTLRLKWAKATGYAAAGAVVSGLLFEAGKVAMEHLWR